MKGYYATPILPLARDKVRYVGEPVVGVVAESRYLAEDAAELIAIDFEPLPAVSIPIEAARAGPAAARRSRNQCGGRARVQARRCRRGVRERAGAGRRPFRMRRHTALAIEPRAYLAEYEPGRDALTLHSATQIPGIIRDALAEPRSICRGIGCAWSRPTSAAASAARARSIRRRSSSARPRGASARRQMDRDRMEDLSATSQAFDEIIEAELALDADGKMLALRADVIGDVGAYSIYPWTAALEPVQVVSFLPGPYRIEHYRGRVQAVATCKAPTGPYRGVGRPVSTFVTERLVDMAAREARPRSEGDPPAQSRAAGRVSAQDRLRHRVGQVRLRRRPRGRLRDGRLRGTAAKASRSPRRRPNGSASASRATPS